MDNQVKYELIGANLNEKLMTEIVKWIYSKNVKVSKYSTLTTSLNSEIVDFLDNLTENRSEFIRECCYTYLDSLYKTFKREIPMFSSKGSFLRSAIYFSILTPVKTKIIKVEQKQEHYVKYNGTFMSRNSFLGNYLIQCGKDMIENDDLIHRNYEVKKKNEKTKKK